MYGTTYMYSRLIRGTFFCHNDNTETAVTYSTTSIPNAILMADKRARVRVSALKHWPEVDDPALVTLYRKSVEELRACTNIVRPFRRPDAAVPMSTFRARELDHLTKVARPPDFERLVGVDDKVEFLNVARTLPSPYSTSAPQLPEYISDAVAFMIETGDALPAWRVRQAERLRDIATSLKPLSRELLKHRPGRLAWVGGSDPDIAFECALVDALELDCVGYVGRRYRHGFSIVGVRSDTGL